jgi:pimeloyl-ACP methyl ester carboxylesterase
MSSAPFRIDVPDAALADLRRRLERTRLPDAGPGEPWDYGISLPYLRELVADWRTRYDWRVHEQRLNALPQFQPTVGGTRVHVVHVLGRGSAPAPLLLVHGWPGAYLEQLGLLGPLGDPAAHSADAADAFDVVLPSAPGFAFSADPGTASASVETVAGLWLELMTGLGYERFFVHGGGIGAEIATRMAQRAPERVAALHLTTLADPAPDAALADGGQATADPPLDDAERAYLAEHARWVAREGAAARQERTRPRTLAYALGDSPAGLAAWIVAHLRAGSDCGGEPERAIERDELLTLVTLWWVTGTIGSALRLGYEAAPALGSARVSVPTSICQFAGGFAAPPCAPRAWAERRYADLRDFRVEPRGGRFPALEQPALLAERLRGALRPLRPLRERA